MELFNRELSWLQFNERVLQEAMDERVPLIERVRFLGIYSNNMDEFYRVRVANLRRMIAVRKKKVDGFKGSSAELYEKIREVVLDQQETFQKAYKKLLLELKAERINFIDEKTIDAIKKQEIYDYFHITLKHVIVPIILDPSHPFPSLQDSSIYLAVKLSNKKKFAYALIKIPEDQPRFYTIFEGEESYLMLIDDIIRLHLEDIFQILDFTNFEAYTIKYTRDAELDFDDDIAISLIDKIEKSIKNRKKGTPVRFIYDEKMPKDLFTFLQKKLNLKSGLNAIPGGRYHNFKDFIKFPDFGKKHLLFEKQIPVAHPSFEGQKSIIKTVMKGDILLHFPYQRFDYVVDLLREAAIDPKVKSIKINVYRLAKNSQIMNALLAAVMNGKLVEVFLELKARFDEENNLYWANTLTEAGAKVIYDIGNLKVHSKLLQIYRKSSSGDQLITYIGTGNFNEKTAGIYSDMALLTADVVIGKEVQKVFGILDNNLDRSLFKHLFVSPINTKRKFLALIDKEIKNHKSGLPSGIKIKMNNLTDEKMIAKLYEASKAGVKIELNIRGICCLVPGIKGKTDNITVISIVDRYLEHARLFIFENGGKPLVYISSADWMERNLDKRIEVTAPIYNLAVQQELMLIFDMQFRGNTKARLIDKDQKNNYRKVGYEGFHAQAETYHYYQLKADHLN